MCSFLKGYTRFLTILFYCGICPFKVKKQKYLITKPDTSNYYKLTISVVMFSIITIQSYEFMRFITESTQYTWTAINMIESLSNQFVYCLCLSNLMLTRHSHAALLNGIQDFDRLIIANHQRCVPHNNSQTHLATCTIIERESYFRRLFCVDLTVAFVCYICNAATAYYMLTDYCASWTEKILQYFYFWIIITFSFITVHTCNVALALSRRLEWTRNTLKTIKDDDDELFVRRTSAKSIEYIEMIWLLKVKFENVFGLTIMLNITIDTLLLIIAFYYEVMYAVMKTMDVDWSTYCMTTVTYIFLPTVKNVYLMWAVNGIGEQVRECSNPSKVRRPKWQMKEAKDIFRKLQKLKILPKSTQNCASFLFHRNILTPESVPDC